MRPSCVSFGSRTGASLRRPNGFRQAKRTLRSRSRAGAGRKKAAKSGVFRPPSLVRVVSPPCSEPAAGRRLFFSGRAGAPNGASLGRSLGGPESGPTRTRPTLRDYSNRPCRCGSPPPSPSPLAAVGRWSGPGALLSPSAPGLQAGSSGPGGRSLVFSACRGRAPRHGRAAARSVRTCSALAAASAMLDSQHPRLLSACRSTCCA